MLDEAEKRSENLHARKIHCSVDPGRTRSFADGPRRTAEAFSRRTETVENIRRNFVSHGFQQALDGKKRAAPPAPELSDGEREDEIIAARLGSPPPGYADRSPRLPARHVVESEIVPSISHETVRQVIKKRDEQPENSISDCSSEKRCGICGRYGGRAGSLCGIV